jgi:adenylate cyclase class IV
MASTNASTKNMEFYEDEEDTYYDELAGDFSVNDKKARNKRSNSTCYSSKHIRQSLALSKTKTPKSDKR